MIEEAQKYAALDWSIIPIRPGTKLPACRTWKDYQTRRPDDETLRRWFAKRSGLAVICGPISGGLMVRDFDDLEAYSRWQGSRPALAETLPTVETARGRHVYFRAALDELQSLSGKETTILPLGDGELRAGGYCLLPPSVHPSGHSYRWLIQLSGQPPLLALADTGFMRATESHRERQRRRRNTEEDRDNGSHRVGEACQASHRPSGDAIERTILESLPRQQGQRNKQVFELARALKAVASLADADAKDLKHLVQQWHTLARPVIGTQPFEETWIDFLRAWPRVRFPKGAEPMAAILERALTEVLPHEARDFEQTELQILVGLCRELQRAAGSGPFYLSARTAGKLLEVDHTTAWRWLFLLQSEGLLSVVTKGTQAGKATRYRYNGSLTA